MDDFSIQICKKTYKQKDNCQAHIEKVHLEDGVKDWKTLHRQLKKAKRERRRKKRLEGVFAMVRLGLLKWLNWNLVS